MALTRVRPAEGRRVKDPTTMQPIAAGAEVDLDTTFWFRRLEAGDIEVHVTKDHFAAVHAAIVAIERDNGGHLIGSQYPGEVIDLDAILVPPAAVPLLGPADAALKRLALASEDDWHEFVCGDVDAAEAIGKRRGDLYEARRILTLFFNAWSEPEIPATPAPATDPSN